MTWNKDVLININAADDLKIAPYTPDMRTTGTPTWIWEVEGRLFVRAYSGTSSRWFQAALNQQAGKIHTLGQTFEVLFARIDDASLNEKIDQAYRQKYAKSSYMKAMISERTKLATVEILPE
ncbi:DUF2255 family protein [Pantoea cypripedii]|uniref:DUF2255 domain-containing protein n=1 Tax=Pantoea cypripedii TaxID=55209 RepID=A0A6B9G665_PANCY|nr:DUF2255 family protein [Pantoea cypripedii]QGY32568.1 DUF2255 domain-containing protein [Pantoea cypripedii]